MRDQNHNSKGKLIPIVAILAVAVVGAVGLTRGCSYASAPTPAETRGQAQRDAPDD